ncbi:fat-body protein 1 [Drosophila hydei]|uniref:Fat-body protein 1 n=1 Tax=Drosophila hydei TaxID=7224 RepID=A0A6J1M251_DROHY|nr:fat-body protein 1 [Drosophila hydei]
MSREDLQRQKFLLDIVQRVQQPLQQDDLIKQDQGLIIDPGYYRGGIDNEMQRVIDMDRQRRLLDEHEVYSIRNVEHVQQLRGVYRLLVRAIDFETLQRNVVYLRRNVNPVLLINALTLAIRDREDTQSLIIPAVQEILPELYLDQQTLERVQRIQAEIENSPRPSFVDVVGLGQRIRQMNPVMRMVMPWRDLHMQLALRKQQMWQQIQNRVVLPLQGTQQDQGISLLTEDIGMRNFMQGLIQELALLEESSNARQLTNNYLEREIELEGEGNRQDYYDINNDRLLGINRRRVPQQQNEDEDIYDNQRERVSSSMRRDDDDDEEVQFETQLHGTRVPLLRNIGQGIRRVLSGNWGERSMTSDVNELPTVDVRSDRLLHVGRRRQNLNRNEPEDEQQQWRLRGIVRGERLSEGRRVDQEMTGNRRILNEDNMQDLTDNLQSVPRNDERLVHINRRRLGQTTDTISPRRVSPIGVGRSVGTINDEDIIQLMRSDNRLNQLGDEEILEMVRRNRQLKEQTLQGRFMGIVRGDRLSEGRRVGDVDAIRDEDILQLIRSDNRLKEMSDEEIIEMVRRNRQRKEQTQQERFMGIVRGDRLSEGRRVDDVDAWRNDDVMQSIRSGSRLGQISNDDISEMLRRKQQERFMRVDRQDESMRSATDNLQTVRRDDERLVHINRRRISQSTDNTSPRRVNTIAEGRRVDGEDTMKVEDIMRLIRSDNRLSELSDDEIVEMLRRNRQRKDQEQKLNMEQGHRYRRSLANTLDESTTRRSEMLLQTLRQLLARLNQERIAMRMVNDEYQLIDNSRLNKPNQDISQRYAVRLNDRRLDSRRNRVLLEQINVIEGRLQQVIGRVISEISNGNVGRSTMKQIDEQLRLERLIGDVLIGRIGDIGILRILRELLQDATVRMDRSGLGISMGDRVLQYTLRRIIGIVDEIREQQLGVYNRGILDLQDVVINDLRVDKLRTFIEDGDIDVTSLVDQPQQSQVVVRQRRLNNKPFTIDMDISAKSPRDVIIRLFLGPRQDANGRELPLEQRRSDFVLLDAINTQLQTGRNRIQYRSTNIAWTTRDATPYSEIYRRVMTALRGEQDQLIISDLVGENGSFPQRLLLPRGRPEGLPMQLLAIVSPVERLQLELPVRMKRLDGVMGISMASIVDNRPLGFPLDRRIENEQLLLDLPNVQLHDVLIVSEN